MNKRITESFTKGKAFIPFITCGDPSLEVTGAAGLCHDGGRGRSDRTGNPVF